MCKLHQNFQIYLRQIIPRGFQSVKLWKSDIDWYEYKWCENEEVTVWIVNIFQSINASTCKCRTFFIRSRRVEFNFILLWIAVDVEFKFRSTDNAFHIAKCSDWISLEFGIRLRCIILSHSKREKINERWTMKNQVLANKHRKSVQWLMMIAEMFSWTCMWFNDHWQ